ncbi:MarR family winged helix-turn-helix transcriptional regulator [Streptomyces sp. NPDC090022]|uniref:MarR family winged helix-turn-helix transcriptional regulator n=1 Tax=Streptomyces sp. NPDC090022 TaxID=3365920 RepID=UPI00380E00D9
MSTASDTDGTEITGSAESGAGPGSGESAESGESTDSGESSDSGGTTDAAEQLLRLTRRLHRVQKRHLEPLGITPAQSRLLRAVAGHGPGEPPRMADLAARLEVVPRAVTTLVDGLEAAGCVRRVPDPANRRVTRIELTDTGRATLGRLRNARKRAAEEILAPLTADQREVLGGLLGALSPGPGRRC